MKARPILFSAPMVRALLEGRKTQTRRIMKPQPEDNGLGLLWGPSRKGPKRGWYCDTPYGGTPHPDWLAQCPYGQPGDLLWVRETFALEHNVEAEEPTHADGRPIKRRPDNDIDGVFPLWVQPHYRATDDAPDLAYEDSDEPECRWKPSIHMPRWASRLTLEITAVRVERLQDISEADAMAEGIFPLTEEPGRWLNGKVNFKYSSPLSAFIGLWCAINGPLAWKDNPFVWVLEFRVHKVNVDELLKRRAA